MHRASRLLIPAALLALSTCRLAGAQSDDSTSKSPPPQIEYANSGEFVVFELWAKGGYQAMRVEDFLAGRSSDQPSIRMYGNGRVVLHDDGKPFVAEFSAAEFHGLVEDLVALGVHELDTETTSAGRRSADDQSRFKAEGRISISVDMPTYTARFRLTGLDVRQTGVLQPIDSEVTWRSVVMVASHYPSNAEIQRLARLERWLGELTRRIKNHPEP